LSLRDLVFEGETKIELPPLFYSVSSVESIVTANIVIRHILIGRNSAVCIVTQCTLDGPVFESRWGDEISCSSPERFQAHSAFCVLGTGSFSGGVKRMAHSVNYPALPVPRLKKERSYISNHTLCRYVML